MFKVLLVASSATAINDLLKNFGKVMMDAGEKQQYIKVAKSKPCCHENYQVIREERQPKFNVTNITIDGKEAENFMALNDPSTTLRVMGRVETESGDGFPDDVKFDVHFKPAHEMMGWESGGKDLDACKTEKVNIEGYTETILPPICGESGEVQLETDVRVLKKVPIGSEVITVAHSKSKGLLFCNYMKLEPADKPKAAVNPPVARRLKHRRMQNAGEDRIISPV
jgi:hypothetical protein